MIQGFFETLRFILPNWNGSDDFNTGQSAVSAIRGTNMFQAPFLTKSRVRLAYAVAVTAAEIIGRAARMAPVTRVPTRLLSNG